MARREGEPRIKVLIVDRDDASRHSTAGILADEGYESIESATEEDARAVLEGAPGVGAVLCDVRTPGAAGLDLVRHLIADFPAIAMLVTTDIDDLHSAELAFDMGADAFLIKPVSRNELLISLSNAVTRHGLEMERRDHLREMERTVTRLRMLTNVFRRIEITVPTPEGDDDELERLSMAISLRDEETGRHLQRMSRYAALLASAVGFANGSIEQVRMATALHDVGKIGVPDTVLLKQGPLSAEERAAMRRHSQLGYQLLAGSVSDVLGYAATVALAHHEWWDGGGYPRGVRGDAIPEVARIAAVADVFDALTSHRVYRPAMDDDAAVALMTELRGRQFEPRLLDAFFEQLSDVDLVRQAFPDIDGGESLIRVLVVDDHEIFVQSLVRLLESQPSLKVVGVAPTVAEAYTAAAAYEPDVILMDLELPDGDGIAATGQMLVRNPRTKVVMLTGRTDDEVFVRAIAAGCAGFVRKTDPVDTLVDAIVAVHEGESLSGPTQQADLPRLLDRLPPTSRGVGAGLSARQTEILGLVAAGMSNNSIAELLHISPDTVRNHVQNALYKLDAHSRLEAVAIAVREGLIVREGSPGPTVE